MVKYKFIRVSVLDPEPGEAALNHFLASHQVIAVDKVLVQAQGEACWALAISYGGADHAVETKRPSIQHPAMTGRDPVMQTERLPGRESST